jgi:hypothetical protein
MDKWQEITEKNIPLDKWIAARTEDKWGYGYQVEAFNFDSEKFGPGGAEAHLSNFSFVEFMELPR